MFNTQFIAVKIIISMLLSFKFPCARIMTCYPIQIVLNIVQKQREAELDPFAYLLIK